MPEIKDLLIRFEKIIGGKWAQKEIIVDVVEKTTGVKLETNSISMKGGCVYIQAKPILKNEILLKKDIILHELGVSIKSLNILDIR